MINQIRSGQLSAPILGDPLAGQRAAARTAGQVGQLGQKAERVGQRVQQDTENAGNYSAQVEGARREREFATDFPDVFANTPENGEGYAQSLMTSWEKRHQEALARVADDPVATSRLNNAYQLELEEKRASFEKAERDWRSDYLNHQYTQSLDDSKQRLGRNVFTSDRGGEPSDALSLIRQFEGFRATPYYDVNALRTGYGSDTITRSDGTIETVTENTRVTREDADRDLRRRAAEFAGGVRDKIGETSWIALSAGQQAALTSIAYNYGSLPDRVSRVIAAGGDVGEAIRGLGGDNDGINRDRRNKEANIFESGHLGGVDEFGVPIHSGPVPDLSKDEAFQDELATAFAQIDAMPNLTAFEKKELRQEAEAELTRAALGSMVQTNATEALALLRSGALDKALSFDDTFRIEAGLISDERKVLEQQVAAQANAQRAADKEAAYRDYQDYISQVGAGHGVPPLSDQTLGHLSNEQRFNAEKAPAVAAARQLVESAPIENLSSIIAALEEGAGGENAAIKNAALEAAKAAVLPRVTDHAAGMSLNERAALISGTTDPSILSALQSQQNSYRSGLENDQVSLIRRTGGQVDPLDMTNPLEALENRFAQVAGIADENSVEPILTTPAERLQFQSLFDEMSLSEKVDVVSHIGANPEISQMFFGEISDQAPFLSYAGQFANASSDLDPMMTAMRGYQAQLDGMKFEGDTPTVITQQLSTTNASSALRGLPDVQQQVVEFGLNYARGLASGNGGVVDAEKVGAGIKDALGGSSAIQRENGAHYVLPMGVKGPEFRNWFNGLTDEDISRMNFGEMPVDDLGTTIDAEYIQKNGRLLTLGNGVYGVEFKDGTEVLGNGPSGRFLLTWVEG